jgi:hypothetical protein
MSATAAFEQFSFALGGVKVFRQRSDGKWRIRCGQYVAPTFTINEDDYRSAEIRSMHQVRRQERRNRVHVKWVSPGQGYQMNETVVRDGTYLSQDNGRLRVQDFEAMFIGGQYTPNQYSAQRAHRLGLIWLDKHRLEKIHQATFAVDAGVDDAGHRGVIRLEPGDCVRVNNSMFGYSNKQFTVEATSYDPATRQVALALKETFNGWTRYDGAESEDEGPGTILGRWNDNDLDKITGLTFSVVPGSSDLQGDGTFWTNVLVDWDDHPDVRVSDSGQYRLEYKAHTHTKWSAEVSVDSRNMIRMKDRGEYDVRVRAETAASRSEWVVAFVEPDSGFAVLPGPPGTLSQSDNLMDDPNFEQGGQNWDFSQAGEVAGDDLTVATGGLFGNKAGRLQLGASHATHRMAPKSLIPVEPGQRYTHRYYRKALQATPTRTLLNVQYFGTDGLGGAQIGTSTTIGDFTSSASGAWVRMDGVHTVPNNPAIVFMRAQAALQYVSGSLPIQCLFDGWRVARINGGASTTLTGTASTGSGGAGGQDWTISRGAVAGKTADPVFLQAGFRGRAGYQSGTGAALNLFVRIMRYDAGTLANPVAILAATAIGEDVTGACANQSWSHYTFDAVDNTADVGEFQYRAEFKTDRDDGRVEVKNRSFQWAQLIGGGSS